MKSYNQFILESKKNLESLYHIVDFNKLFYILNNNKIKSYKFQNISTTRDVNLVGYVGDSPTSIFKLELDGKKISQDFDTREFTYVSRTNVAMPEEEEEQILTNEIPNAFKYIKKIILMKGRVERLKDSGWFTTDGGFFGNERTQLPILLQQIIDLMKEKGFDELYVQENGKIKKDDEYIQSILEFPIETIHHGYAYYFRGNKEVYNDKWKVNEFKDIIEPIDNRNEEIDQLVVGYDYDNLWLDKNINIPKIQKEDFNLYVFDYTYELDDVILDKENEVNVKKAHLNNIIKT